ncbi:hypothetical protein TSUD_135470 [Trifolium subterraneum]|uniref:Uncharacterized protein n=1 Tax=Trifolium subterraneum TaxID=3900 RepID=A0A2Z6NHJ5_TRISU|nr:hypothetical protein TSUD_135470 [Trifolium subterraneum]
MDFLKKNNHRDKRVRDKPKSKQLTQPTHSQRHQICSDDTTPKMISNSFGCSMTLTCSGSVSVRTWDFTLIHI